MDGWMGGWMDGWMDGWVGGWMDGWMDGYSALSSNSVSRQCVVVTAIRSEADLTESIWSL